MGTKFVTVYNRFLGKITDDMYVELTPQDTVRDLRNLILEAIPGFEFPRCNLYDYEIAQMVKNQDELEDEDFVIGILWDELDSDVLDDAPPAMVECSTFNATLTSEEVNILALLMMCAWLQRQVTSIENVRMKYSGSDFKMTSQANHLSKLLALLGECQRQSLHMQRLYKRRKLSSDGRYESNWSSLAEVSALE
jgi:hypothetical protein